MYEKNHFAFFPNVTFYSVNQQTTFSLKQFTLLTSLEFVNVCNVELAREVIFFTNRIYLLKGICTRRYDPIYLYFTIVDIGIM